jgi:hypothetical protein
VEWTGRRAHVVSRRIGWRRGTLRRSFQLAHRVEEAEFATAEQLAASKRAWVVHEVETTVDVCPGNRALTWFLGGLDYQIDHHLFPAASATQRTPHSAQRSPHTSATCARSAAWEHAPRSKWASQPAGRAHRKRSRACEDQIAAERQIPDGREDEEAVHNKSAPVPLTACGSFDASSVSSVGDVT